jgi:extracellular elastinolytic metalloproteinase
MEGRQSCRLWIFVRRARRRYIDFFFPSLPESSHSVLTIAQFASSTPTVSLDSLVPSLETQLDSKLHSHPPTLEYLIRPDNSVALTHVAQFQNKDLGTWVEAFTCAHSGELLSVTDFVAHASYTVVPINKLALPDGLETLEDPDDPESSPLGWHSDGTDNTTVTK